MLDQWLKAPFAILIDAATYLVSAAGLGWVRAVEPAPRRPENPHLGREMIEARVSLCSIRRCAPSWRSPPPIAFLAISSALCWPPGSRAVSASGAR